MTLGGERIILWGRMQEEHRVYTAGHHWQMLRRILWQNRRELALALACIGAATGLLLLIPAWARALVQEVLPAKSLAALNRHLLRGVVLVVLIQAALFAKDFIRLRLSHRIGAGIRERLFGKILAMPLKFVPEQRRGDLISRLSNDITVFQDGLMRGIFRLIPNTIMLLCLLVLMFAYSLRLSAITLLLIGPMGWAIYYFVGKIRRKAKAAQERLAHLNNLVEEAISGLKEIKSFGQEEEVGKKFGEMNARALQAFVAQDRLRALHPASVLVVTILCVAVLILVSAWLVIEGTVAVDELVAFLTCLGLTLSPIQEITGSFGFISRIYAVMDRFEEILRQDSEPLGNDGLPDFPEVKGEISLCSMGFSYPEGFQLTDIDFEVAAGETVAIVGSSGAGKSTLLNLLPRFLEPERGRIEIDGLDIRQYSLASLRRQFAWVPQEPVLFYGTLAENLAFSRPGAAWEEILDAAAAAHVEEFARKLPEGYHTQIGQYGSKLSAGQRQRVAIARALLSGARIFILDEPTSALDPESEHMIQDALAGLKGRHTVLIVAHRLSTIRHADRIFVLDNGRLAEQGSHRQLLAQKGLYHKLYHYHLF